MAPRSLATESVVARTESADGRLGCVERSGVNPREDVHKHTDTRLVIVMLRRRFIVEYRSIDMG